MALSTRRTQHRDPTHIGLPFATQSGEACVGYTGGALGQFR
jgi:hypothetical protein